MDVSRLNEDNYKQALLEYMLEKYGSMIEEFLRNFIGEFPERGETLDGKKYFKNFIDWLIIEKPLPETGKTIVEEFVHAHPGIGGGMKKRMLQMRNVIRSEFEILSKNGVNMRIKDLASGKEHEVKLYSDSRMLRVGLVISGRIHPFGDTFRFAGIFHFNAPCFPSVENVMEIYDSGRIREAESIMIYSHSKLAHILNKYPSQWVDGICNALSVGARRKREKVESIESLLLGDVSSILKKLPERSVKALKLVLEGGGFVKLGALKDFSGEIGFWWVDRPPESDIGILRLHGLMAIGKMPAGGRMHSVALIPSDLRESLKEAIRRVSDAEDKMQGAKQDGGTR